MRRPAVRDRVAVARDDVVETETRTPKLADACVDADAIVEVGGLQVPDVRLEDERLDPLVAERVVAARELLEIRDPRDLEPHEVVRVVHDSLSVRLGEAHGNVGVEVEPVHSGHSMGMHPA